MVKFNKIYFIFLYFLFINSCGLLKEDNGNINYKTIDFDNYTPPQAPSYDSRKAVQIYTPLMFYQIIIEKINSFFQTYLLTI